MKISQQQKVRPKGEAWVWLTAMGLALGLVMILFLLGLIAWNGLTVFWPRPAALVSFDQDSATRFQGSAEVAGIITERQAIHPRSLTEEQKEAADPEARVEVQLYVGNRDAFGESFAYFNAGDIAAIDYPHDLIQMERMEWGDAFLYPLRLEYGDGLVVTAQEAEFDAVLREQVDEVRQRRKQIEQLEKRQIGRINLQIDALRLKQTYFRQLEETLTPAQAEELAQINRELEEMEQVYAPLAARARELRDAQSAATLHYQLASGQERSMPLGMVVDYYYPNQLSLIGKVALYLRNIGSFIVEYPREANTEGGIFPAIFGTFVMTLVMSVLVTPFGVLAAIYLREYASQGVMVRSVRIAINNLAGVPSIVFGVFGLGFFVYFVGGWVDEIFFPHATAINRPTFGTGGVLWASLTLALMTVPVVIVATEEALAAVSRGVREGALACGASKWQTIRTLVLPAAAPGILTGLVLAMARGAGEVAPLMLVGVVAMAPDLPLDGVFPFFHLERKFMHLGFHIYDLGFQSPDSEAAKPMVFATTLVLILLVVVLNLAAIIIRNRLRKKYATNAF